MKIFTYPIGISLLLIASFSTLAGSETCQPLRVIPGVTKDGDPPIAFKKSDINRKIYGVHTGFFYGDWSWSKDFNIRGITASPLGNEVIAEYAARCYTSYPMGRIHYGYLERRVEETQHAYMNRVFDQVVEAKKELLILQQAFPEKLNHFITSGIDPGYKSTYSENMNKHLMQAQLQIIQFVDTQLIYTLEGMGNYAKLHKEISGNLADILSFIILIGDVPDADLWARDMLAQNTNNVLGTYGLFFGEDQKIKLRKRLDDSLKNDHGDNLKAVKEGLESWAMELEAALLNSFDQNSTYFQIATKLKFIFGTRDPANESVANSEILHRLGSASTASEGDLRNMIESVPNDPSLWEGIRHGQ